MFSLFNKRPLLALLGFLALNSISSSLMGCECWDTFECNRFECDRFECNRMYIGAFGGGIYSNSTRISQMGTAFFAPELGGPLAVFARGRTKKNSTGYGGVQIGYEWSSRNTGCSDWTIAPAAEIEAYFFHNHKKGHLINPTDRMPEHDFLDSFHMNIGVGLVNIIFSLKSSCLWGFTPYIGGGIGATRISIRNAKSLQTDPEELGVNHFNSRTRDSSWAFAAQAKAGLRFKICDSFHIFGEYRYLFVDSSNYIFGSTVFPGHAVTSPWNVKVKNINYNLFAVGVQYDL